MLTRRLLAFCTAAALCLSSATLANAELGGQQVATGPAHSCAITRARTLECWGANVSGQLGNGTTTASTTPVEVAGIPESSRVVIGQSHTCAVDLDGNARCWGSNALGQLGDGTTTNRSTPVLVSGIGTVNQIAAGAFHTCASTTTGLWCWGFNESGQIGDGTTTNRPAPVQIVAGSVGNLAAGLGHTCAVFGGAKCWGSNAFGQLGDGTTVDRLTPVSVSGGGGFSVLAAGGSHTCALSGQPSSPKCWGYNGFGQLGDGTTTDRPTPVTIGGLTDAYQLVAGSVHTCARTSSPSFVKCWGANDSGQVGDGTTTDRLAPVDVSGLSAPPQIAAIGGGGLSSCAVVYSETGAGTSGVRCWGQNATGQLGDGTTTSRNAPTSVLGFDDRCVAPQKTKLVIRKLDTLPGDDVLTWKGEVQLPFPFDPPLDPVARGVHALMYEYTYQDRRVIDDVTVPAGAYDPITKKGWKVNAAGTVWTYVNAPNDLPSKINGVKITTSARAPGLVKYQIKGKAGAFGLSGQGQTGYLFPLFSLETPSSARGQCAFGTLYVVPNGHHCFFNASGSTLTCR